MHEDEAPPMEPSSSHVNEDNFDLIFGHMDSLATRMENLTNLVTNMSQSLEDINERLRRHGI